ncbi:hypothetical protein NECAME_01346 [Necator americanus]|nr:hypothetical protein NECAME_01346 [Necator americanus]ETN86218.1 hypothetical protein NECAME_01346 [Necator americanus]
MDKEKELERRRQETLRAHIKLFWLTKIANELVDDDLNYENSLAQVTEAQNWIDQNENEEIVSVDNALDSITVQTKIKPSDHPIEATMNTYLENLRKKYSQKQ